MMKILRIFLLMALAIPVFAQDADDAEATGEDPRAQQTIRAAHAAYITERLSLTPEEAEKFWPVYREFAKKRLLIRRQLRVARRNGQDEKNLIELDLKLKQQELDLEKEYSARFLQIIPAEKLLNLRQAEADFRKLLLRQLQQRQRRQQLRDPGPPGPDH
jgi:hypothetical protein